MKKKIKFLLLFAVAMSHVPLALKAQEDTITTTTTTTTTKDEATMKPRLFGKGTSLKGFTLGVNGGVVFPAVLGSLNLDNKGTKPQLGYGAYLGYSFTQNIELLVNYQGAPSIKGSFDNKEFSTKLTAAVSGKLRLTTGGLSFIHSKPIFALFVQGGFGYAMYTPDYIDDKQEGTQFSTLGAGMMIRIADPISFVLGADMNYLTNNYMFVQPTADRPLPSSKWSYAYAGLEVYFGGKGPAKKWYNPAKAMYDELSEIQSNNDEIDALNRKINDLSSKVDALYKDTDGDGVPDYRDKEPNTPAGVQVDGAGREIKFPEPAVIQQPVVDNSKPNVDTIAPGKKGTIQFAFDSARLIGDSQKTIKELVNNELRNASSVTLEGYTCDIGTKAYNKGLGKRRANSVKKAMVRAGMDSSKINVVSYGEDNPAYPNTSKENRQLNRRVEIKIQD